jgi:hypothetical protein
MKMDAQTDASPPELNGASTTCAECEQPTANPILSRAGASLCAECVKAYYIACAGCGGLIPQDEALARSGGSSSGLACCADCFSKPAGETNTAAVDETLIESLISEYISLHAEEKRISERMEVVKEQLKMAAAGRQRAGNAVTLRAGDAAVRCSYRTSLKCEAEATEALAGLLDEDEFSALFERKLSFNPVKDRLAEFLARTDDEYREAREAVRAALRETETVTLSVVAARRK